MKTLMKIGLLLLLAAAAARAGENRWFHVFVQEKGADGEKVRVNLPFSIVEAVLPLIDEDDLHGGKLRIEGDNLSCEDLRAIVEAVRSAGEGEYVHVEGADDDVVVMKKGDFLLFRARGESTVSGESSSVDVRVRLSIADALVAGEGDELDILGAIRALGEEEQGDFIVVKDESEIVRVWIDDSSAGE